MIGKRLGIVAGNCEIHDERRFASCVVMSMTVTDVGGLVEMDEINFEDECLVSGLGLWILGA